MHLRPEAKSPRAHTEPAIPMSTQQIYVNIPSRDLPQAREFYARLGFGLDTRFSTEDAACIVVNDSIHIFLHTEEDLRRFTSKPVVHAADSTGVILCLAYPSRAEVDALVQKAVDAGAVLESTYDRDGIYSRGFRDLDDFIWKINCVDPAAFVH